MQPGSAIWSIGAAVLAALLGGVPNGRAADIPGTLPTVQQVLDRCIAARGGYPAWRKLDTLIWAGHLESVRSPVPSLPFRLVEKAPDKSRFEINEPSQRSIRVFDGTSGWKMRNGRDGRPDVQRFTPQEIRYAGEAAGLEGPVIDFRARTSPVEFELEGKEEIDGHSNYRLVLKLPSGERQHVWVDAKTYLESRYDRTTYSSGGASGIVTVRYRDYRKIEGLAFPSAIEIGSATGGVPDRMVIEKVALNPKIEDRDFGGFGDSSGRTPAAVDPRRK